MGQEGTASKKRSDGPVVVFRGHRPHEVGGYDQDNEIRHTLKRYIRRALRRLNPSLVYTCMGIGTEQDVAEICQEADIPYAVFLLKEDQEKRWNIYTQENYRLLLAGAKEVRGGTFEKLISIADHGLMVWNGKAGFLSKAFDEMSAKFKTEVINPKKVRPIVILDEVAKVMYLMVDENAPATSEELDQHFQKLESEAREDWRMLAERVALQLNERGVFLVDGEDYDELVTVAERIRRQKDE